MKHLITIGNYDEYKIIGMIECDIATILQPENLVRFLQHAGISQQYYYVVKAMLDRKMSHQKFVKETKGIGSQRFNIAELFAKWLVNDSGLPAIDVLEYKVGL